MLCSQGMPTRSPTLEPSRALAELFDHTHDLMPGNHRGFFLRQLAFDHVKIGAANAAHFHAHEDFALAGPRVGRVGEFERIGSTGAGAWSKQAFIARLSPGETWPGPQRFREASPFGTVPGQSEFADRAIARIWRYAFF